MPCPTSRASHRAFGDDCVPTSKTVKANGVLDEFMYNIIGHGCVHHPLRLVRSQRILTNYTVNKRIRSMHERTSSYEMKKM
jgi:hypothetical protein